MRTIAELDRHADQMRAAWDRAESRLVGAPLGGGGAGAELLCRILSKAGMSAPYLYSAEQVEHDGGTTFNSDDYVALPGGIAMSGNLVNLAEVGASGLGVLWLPVGAVVPFRAMGTRFCTNTSFYRGTYG